MATIYYTGAAQAVAQETHVTFANIEKGDVFKLTINRKSITITATDATVASLVALFVAAIAASTIPEWQEVTASTGTDDQGSTTHLILTSATAGVPFTVTGSTVNAGTFDVIVTEVSKGSAAQNEIQRVHALGTPTGGTLTLTFAGQTTGALNYNDDAATVQAALEALSNIAPGDVTVTLNGTCDWTIEFSGAYAATDVPAVTATSSLTGGCTIAVNLVTGGEAGTLETYTLTFPGDASAFRFAYTGGYYSPWIATEGSADDIRESLEALNIGGDSPAYAVVDVTGDAGGPFTIRIVQYGAFGADGNLTISASYLGATGIIASDDIDSVILLTQTESYSTTATDEVQQVAIVGGPSGGTFTLTFEGQTTAGIAFDAEPYEVRDALILLSNIGPGTSQVNTLLNNVPTAGTFTLTYSGQTTAAIAFDASAADIQTALEALSTIGSGNVVCAGGPMNAANVTVTFQNALGFQPLTLTLTTAALTPTSGVAISTTTAGVYADVHVTGDAGGPYTVNFKHTLSGTDVRLLSGSGASLTGMSIASDLTQAAAEAVNETQVVELPDDPTGGTFTLTFNAETTGTIAYNATAATVQTALEGLATPAPGDFSVTGPAGGPWIIEFTGNYAGSDVDAMTGDGSSLTGANTQTVSVAANTTDATGPSDLANADNYSGGALPSAGDVLIFADISTDVTDGLTGLSGITLGELHIKASFAGTLGRPPVNESGYFEYRTRAATIKATKVFVGEGEGSGSAFVSIDASNVQTEVIVQGTGASADNSTPAFCWKGSNASNVFRAFKGNWGIAPFAGDTATVATLQVGYVTDKESDSEGVVGGGCDLDAVSISGGTTTLALDDAAAGAIVVTGGTVTILGDQGADSLRVSGDGYVYWATVGTLGGNTVLSDDATLDFSGDMRAKTITNPIDVYSRTAKIIDPFQVVGSLVVDFNFADCVVNDSLFGSNVRLTRGAPA